MSCQQAAERLSDVYARKVRVVRELAATTAAAYDALLTTNPYDQCLLVDNSTFPFSERLNQKVQKTL